MRSLIFLNAHACLSDHSAFRDVCRVAQRCREMQMRRRLVCLAALAAVASPSAEASEGAASYYFAGAFGSFLVAVPPEPGFTAASQTLMYGGQASRAVLNGRVTFGLNAFALYEFIAGSYTFEQPVLGGRLQIGAGVPVLSYANLNTSLQTGRFGAFTGGASDFNVGDTLLNPFALYWNSGDFNVKFTEYV